MSKYSKEMRAAMRQLLEHYEELERGNESRLDPCPLCEAAYNEAKLNNPNSNPFEIKCYYCPWTIETGEECTGRVTFPVPALRNFLEYYYEEHGEKYLIVMSKWRRRRIKELKEWLKK